MRTSRGAALALVLVLAGCAKGREQTSDSAAGNVTATPAPAPTPTPAASPLSLASVAGKWNVVATPTDGKDTASTKLILTATADTTGWTQTYTGRKPVPMRVRVDGDSIISTAGPYPSFRRKNVQVTTNSVWRLQDGKLVGTTVAHYNVKGADSVLTLRTEGTKAP